MAPSDRAPDHNHVISVQLERDLRVRGAPALVGTEKSHPRKVANYRSSRAESENEGTSRPSCRFYCFLSSASYVHVASVHECSWWGRAWAWPAEGSMQRVWHSYGIEVKRLTYSADTSCFKGGQPPLW